MAKWVMVLLPWASAVTEGMSGSEGRVEKLDWVTGCCSKQVGRRSFEARCHQVFDRCPQETNFQNFENPLRVVLEMVQGVPG